MATGGGERLGEDPAFVRRLFDASPDGLWLFDDDAVTLWANRRMARIVGGATVMSGRCFWGGDHDGRPARTRKSTAGVTTHRNHRPR